MGLRLCAWSSISLFNNPYFWVPPLSSLRSVQSNLQERLLWYLLLSRSSAFPLWYLCLIFLNVCSFLFLQVFSYFSDHAILLFQFFVFFPFLIKRWSILQFFFIICGNLIIISVHCWCYLLFIRTHWIQQSFQYSSKSCALIISILFWASSTSTFFFRLFEIVPMISSGFGSQLPLYSINFHTIFLKYQVIYAVFFLFFFVFFCFLLLYHQLE